MSINNAGREMEYQVTPKCGSELLSRQRYDGSLIDGASPAYLASCAPTSLPDAKWEDNNDADISPSWTRIARLQPHEIDASVNWEVYP